MNTLIIFLILGIGILQLICISKSKRSIAVIAFSAFTIITVVLVGQRMQRAIYYSDFTAWHIRYSQELEYLVENDELEEVKAAIHYFNSQVIPNPSSQEVLVDTVYNIRNRQIPLNPDVEYEQGESRSDGS